MNKSRIYVANWKMQMSYAHAAEFCTRYASALDALSKQAHAQIILCPSFVCLQTVITQCARTSIAVGAQNCAPHARGAYTAQIDAQSLQEIGCTYCIVGHSEARTYLHETPANIALKIKQLSMYGITPIICIGEDMQNHVHSTTHEVLTHQLDPIITQLISTADAPYLIAYEPVWAIGTGVTPEPAALSTTGSWIKQHIAQHNVRPPAALLYGGSVTPENAARLRMVDPFDGFLIGGASLDFQMFEKIVS